MLDILRSESETDISWPADVTDSSFNCTGFCTVDDIAVSQHSLMLQKEPVYSGSNRAARIWKFKL